MTNEEVVTAVEERDVRFIRLWFTDILGRLKSFSITRDEVRSALEHGMGFDHFYLSPELEYFYFRGSEAPEVLDRGGHFDLTTLDAASDLRRDTVIALEEVGIAIEYSHHEVGPSQHEIDMRYDDALRMADNVAWSRRNRSAMVRVPVHRPGQERTTRAEMRCPDPACNPDDLSHEERERAGIDSLPETLGEAIELGAASELLLKCLGEHIHSRYVDLKREEWEDYRVRVTPYEVERYLPLL